MVAPHYRRVVDMQEGQWHVVFVDSCNCPFGIDHWDELPIFTHERFEKEKL